MTRITMLYFVMPLVFSLSTSLFAQQAQWELVRENLFGEIAVDPTDPNVIFVFSWQFPDGGFYKSTDGGETWVIYQEGYEGLGSGGTIAGAGTGGILIDPTNPQRLWVYGGPFRGIVRSEDGGMTAVRADTAISFSHHGYAVTAFAYDHARNVLYAAEISGFGGVFRSLDRGKSWQMLSRLGFTLHFEPYCFVLDIESGWLFSGSSSAGIYRSTDSGETWEAIGTDVVGFRPIWLMAQVPGSHTMYAAGRTGGVFKSYDLGNHWISASTALTDSGQFEGGLLISSLDTNYVFVGSQYHGGSDEVGGVYWSPDGGNTWRIIHLGLPMSERFEWDVFSLAQSPVSHDLYVTLIFYPSKALYKLSQELLTPVDDQAFGQFFDFSLQQNYPNPFNAQTRIGFSMSKTGLVSLDIYDVEGHHVLNLLTGEEIAGRHLINWNGKNSKGGDVSSGIYLYKLTVGKEVLTRKLLVIR